MRRISRILLVFLLIFLAACQPGAEPPTEQALNPTRTVRSATEEPTPGDEEPTPEDKASPTPRKGGQGKPVITVSAILPIAYKVPERVKETSSDSFGAFRAPAAEAQPSFTAPEIAPDLGNVRLTALLSEQQRERIAQNGFVVSPGESREFYELYERARYEYVPVFVTSDSLLHVYHLLFDKTLRRAETGSFIPILASLDWELLRTSVAQYEALHDTEWGEAALRNAAYFAVAVKLLTPDWAIPEALEELAGPDLANIEQHAGMSPSAIFPAYPFGEDWSQYVARGHYTQSEELTRYFKAMMWHGRMTFRGADVTETRQAALLTLAMRQTTVEDRPASALWSTIYEPTVFFVGRSDDLTPKEYGPALDAAYRQVEAPEDLLDDASFAKFQEEITQLRAPEILGMIVARGTDQDSETKGLRFMGQRFVPDSFVFQQLIDDAVPGRGLPKALDFFAALGSERALEHLEESGDLGMPNYEQNLTKMRATFAGYDEQVWTQNLYWSWIHTLRPLLEPAGERHPQFMRGEAWTDKQLNTALGSWTELKRDTILYGKQVYAEMGAGALPSPKPEPPKGYVEPVPQLFGRVEALTQLTIDGLDERGLLDDEDRRALEAMLRVATTLRTIAQKQLRGETPTEEEYEFLRFYGAEIEALTYAASDESSYQGRGGDGAGGEELQAAVVADVATNPAAGEVLEEGVGRIFEIYVAAPIEGRLVLAKGGVFSHYEFAHPMSNRLTDEAWRELLDAGKAPPLAAWTSSYLVDETVSHQLERTIRDFNESLVRAVWLTEFSLVEPYLAGEEQQTTQAYIDQLKGAKQFHGMKLVSLAFLSADFQDEDHATITTRESWSEELYSGSPYAGEPDPVLVGVRAPYETGVTYTMQRDGDVWQITKIVTRPDPPEWAKP